MKIGAGETPHAASARPARKRDRPKLPPCGAKKKQGTGHCSHVAGYKTDHVGEGRCYLHGGLTPIKHGRYSKVKRQDLREALADLADDPTPYDVSEEVQLLRGLVKVVMNKTRDFDPMDVAKMAGEAIRAAERRERMVALKSISLATLGRIMHEMGRSVEAIVEDRAKVEKIQAAWLEIRV